MKMKNEVKVSIIVITYNQEKTIARTLHSILSQVKDFPIEIIIGDDASEDDTENICKEYAQKYKEIKYIRNEKNKGLRDNYFDCLLEAQGEYIADLAGDDFWIDPLKLQKQVEILDTQKDVNLVCTDWKNYYENSKTFGSPWSNGRYPYKDLFNSNEITLKLLSHLNPAAVHLCTALYRKETFLKLYQENKSAFRCKDFIVEDLPLIVLFSTVGKIKYLDFPSLAYSIHDKSVTGTSDFDRVFDFYYSVLLQTHYLADLVKIDQRKLEEVYKRIIHHIVMQAFHLEDEVRMNKSKELIKKWEIGLNFKTQIILKISQNKMIWKNCRIMWNLIRKNIFGN